MRFFLAGILGVVFLQATLVYGQTPTPQPATTPSLSRAERWDGSFVGCQANATPAERSKWGKKVPLVCGCLATYLVNLCQKTEADDPEKVKSCLLNLNPTEANKVVDECYLKAKTEVVLNPFIK
jgi:hypothetical protein